MALVSEKKEGSQRGMGRRYWKKGQGLKYETKRHKPRKDIDWGRELEACGEEKGTCWKQKPRTSSSISKENGRELNSFKTSHQPRRDRERLQESKNEEGGECHENKTRRDRNCGGELKTQEWETSWRQKPTASSHLIDFKREEQK